MFSFLKLLATGLLTGASVWAAQAAPPVPPADLTVLASRGQSFALALDGRPLTRGATQQVHIGWLAPGRHWADLSVFSPYSAPVRFQTIVWLQPGLDSRYMLVVSPYGPRLQSLGAVVPGTAGYGAYGAPGGYGPAPYGGGYGAAPGAYGTAPGTYGAPVPPQGNYGPDPYNNYPGGGTYNAPPPPQGSYTPAPGGYSQPQNMPANPTAPGGYAPAPNGNYPNNGSYNGQEQPQGGYTPAPGPGGYSQPQSPNTYPAPQGDYTPNGQDPNGQLPGNPDPNAQDPNGQPGGYLAPLAPAEARDLAQELRQQPSDDARLDVARQALAGSSLQAEELAELMRTFSREHGRAELAKFGYAHVSDQANFGRVYSTLRDPASTEEIRQALGLQRTY